MPILLDIPEDLADVMARESIPVHDIEKTVRYCEISGEREPYAESGSWSGKLQSGDRVYQVVYHNIGERYVLEQVKVLRACAYA